MSLQRTAGRIEARLEDIRVQLQRTDEALFRSAGRAAQRHSALGQLAHVLCQERVGLEERLPGLQEEIFRRLVELGSDACYLEAAP